RFARLAVVLRDGVQRRVRERCVVAADAHGGMFRAQPARPVARLEFLKLVSARNRIDEDEIRNRRIQLPDRLRQHAAQRGPCKSGALGVAALEQSNGQEMLRLRRLHAAHDVQLVGDARAARQERGKVHPGNLRRDAAERPAAGPAWFRVPCFKLARRAAKPEQDAMLLRLLRRGGENWVFKQPGETHRAGQRAAGQALEKKPSMKLMLARRALAGRHGWRFAVHFYGIVKNSALVISAHIRSRTASAGLSVRTSRKALACFASSESGARPYTARNAWRTRSLDFASAARRVTVPSEPGFRISARAGEVERNCAC